MHRMRRMQLLWTLPLRSDRTLATRYLRLPECLVCLAPRCAPTESDVPQSAIVEMTKLTPSTRPLIPDGQQRNGPPRKTAVSRQPRRVRFGELFDEIFSVANDPQCGFVLWVKLPRGTDALELLNRALREYISLNPGMMFSATRKFRNFVRINCGHPWNARTEHAVERLGQLVRDMAADSR